VVPTGADGIAAAAPGAGAKDGSVADRIALLGSAADGPDRAWSALVVSIGSGAKTEANRSQLADLAHENAVGAQLSGASVDLDEENINLVQYQHAYQGAARVMTAVDEALDVLINHTGLVGR
jgi:flagellar hook-associated protein 1 FlgK